MLQRRDPVMLAWALGLGLAVLAYVVGPQNLLFQMVDTFNILLWRLSEVIGDLSLVARDAVRSLAIGLYVTFLVLSLLVIRHGGRARAALFWVSLLFVGLIGRVDMVTDSNARWVLALALSGAGALIMTQRLRQTALVPRGL